MGELLFEEPGQAAVDVRVAAVKREPAPVDEREIVRGPEVNRFPDLDDL